MPGIGIVSNPSSRQNRRDPTTMYELRRTVDGCGLAAECGTPDDLFRAAGDFRKQEIDVLAINGGDGTLHVALSIFDQAYGTVSPLPAVLHLRGGAMNTVANALGVRGRTLELARRVVGKYRTGRPFRTAERELLRVGTTLGFLFGTGAIAGYLRRYYETGRPGAMTAAMVLLRGAASALAGGRYGRALVNRWRGRVLADGREWAPRDYLAVGASCIDQIGLGFRPFPRAGSEPGRFAALGIHASAAGFIADLPRIRGGRAMTPGKTVDQMASELRLASERPFDYVVDGDLHPARGELAVHTGPRVCFILD